MKRQWTKEEAWAWYHAQPWLRGCNFIGSDCCSRIDMWQSFDFEKHMETAERELTACEELGFNTVRLIIEFDVWVQEREAFMDHLEQMIAACARHHQKVVLVLACEAQLCRGEKFIAKPLGEQVYALGYHQGRFPLTEEEKAMKPYHPLERAECHDDYLTMVREVVSCYGKDERVLFWNVYNEPGIVLGERAKPLVEELFAEVRALDPMQPLAADLFMTYKGPGFHNPAEEAAVLNSDIVSWHCYAALEKFVFQYEFAKSFGRPVMLTEWLNRISHSEVKDIYPFLYANKIACWCWGFVVGKTQTHEPWDSLWEQYDREHGNVDYDFTRWQHDLYRPNLRPYDPHETELIRRVNTMADAREKGQMLNWREL